MSKPNAQPAAEPVRDYLVVTPVELGGVIYRADDVIELTDAQAEHPLKVGAVKPREAK